jgi:hypothetical protein
MLAHRLQIRNYGRDTESLTILMGLAYLPGSFLPILALTARLVWRIRAEGLLRRGSDTQIRPPRLAAVMAPPI